MTPELRDNLTSRSLWRRALYMLVFAFAYSVAETVAVAVVLVQFGITLVTGRPNEALVSFGGKVSRYVYDLMLFLTFNTEARPFPFDDEPRATARFRADDRPRPESPIPPASVSDSR